MAIKARTQLEEKSDVVTHREYGKKVWDASINEDNEDHLIQAVDLMKIYKDGTAAVNNNTFTVKAGEVFGLLGPNGAGKSSMFNIMTADMKRSGGDVKILKTPLD